MPKKIDKEKEQAFIEYFCEGDSAGNATASCIKAGWSKDKSPRQMGAYLKNKYRQEIRDKNEERISGTSGMAISVLQDLLLNSEQDTVKLNTARLLLELGNFSSQTINLNVDNSKQKTDIELIEELNVLMQTIPNFAPKVKAFTEMTEETEAVDSEDLKDTEKRVIN
jgi:hypothetical protein|tara:strand:- start:451 stop:951 length:501 start_codon:yes stop_codon:yes gene_type:complete